MTKKAPLKVTKSISNYSVIDNHDDIKIYFYFKFPIVNGMITKYTVIFFCMYTF